MQALNLSTAERLGPCTRSHGDDIEAIVTADFLKNHAGREYTLDHALIQFRKYTALQLPYLRTAKVITIFSDKGGGLVEFHCMNGGNGRDLTQAVNQALTLFSSQYTQAVTYYDNARINDLMQYKEFPVNVQKIDAGADKTYAATFQLQGATWEP